MGLVPISALRVLLAAMSSGKLSIEFEVIPITDVPMPEPIIRIPEGRLGSQVDEVFRALEAGGMMRREIHLSKKAVKIIVQDEATSRRISSLLITTAKRRALSIETRKQGNAIYAWLSEKPNL